MNTITVKEVEYISFNLAKQIVSFNEPIPDFSTRFPNILESCAATPFQSFSGKSLYPTIISKASINPRIKTFCYLDILRKTI